MVDAKSKPKILCVDDEDGVRQALSRLLHTDFDVLLAKDAEEGLKTLHSHTDLCIVLSDYRMPGQNGVEFLRQAKIINPIAVRAILSGQMDLRQMSEALNGAEIHRFILKPWENEYLRVQMLEALQTHRLLASREELRALSITDPVTGLTNHRYFQDQLRKLCEMKSLVSLIMIDVDHFKHFNDEYGHPQGDRLLQELSQILSTGRGPGEFVSRYGGEEFAVVLPLLDLKSAKARAERLRCLLESHPFKNPMGQREFISVSLGVASFPSQASTSLQLIERADQALLNAKRSGRNRTVVAVS